MKKLLATLLVLGVAWGCRPPPPPAEVAEEPTIHAPVPLTEQQREGQMIYETMCWTCHGVAGRGDGPAVQAGSIGAPPTFHTQDYLNASTESLRSRFMVVLEQADPNHPHMQYVASLLKPERFTDALSFIPALGYPAEIPGSALAGERIYAFRCVGCHGVLGKGDGRASPALVDMPPADFTTDTLIASQDWDALYNRIREGGRAVHGSSMPPWGIVLSDADMWDLVAYLATYQPNVLRPPSWMQ